MEPLSKDPEGIGKRIKWARVDKGLTLIGLSELSGISPIKISAIENDKRERYSLHDLNKLRKALGLSLSYTMDGIVASDIKELLKHLDGKIAIYEEMKNENLANYITWRISADLMIIKMTLDEIEKTIPDFDKYSTMFQVSIKEQVKRLKEHESYRSGWTNINLNYCFGKIKDNLNVVSDIGTDDLETDMKNLINHLADIANYANMAILKCQKVIDGKAKYNYEEDE
ncbi:MAG: helix-turn-helix domain-containing protein [Treponema sp.]|jgi:transcriptional regulator with XRE-family HTH domain|nr:helix-turn-helix domain-containing protein [Treponema sp.]